MQDELTVTITDADIECFRAIFGFRDTSMVDVDGDDREALEHIAQHRTAAMIEGARIALEAYKIAEKRGITAQLLQAGLQAAAEQLIKDATDAE